MKRILIVNGPNLNLLGKREPEIYGSQSFEQWLEGCKQLFPGVQLHHFQSNVEGELINKIHEAGFDWDGIVLNAGAYTHTSIAIGDAVKGIKTPVVEVHISNVYAREEFRQKSHISSSVKGVIVGLGLKGYELAIRFLVEN